jgi:hypothetical protein
VYKGDNKPYKPYDKEELGVLVGKVILEQEILDAKNRDDVILIKLSIINDMSPKVQDGDDAYTIWKVLQEMHETSYKVRVFFLSIMLLLINIKGDSLLKHMKNQRNKRSKTAIGRKNR